MLHLVWQAIDILWPAKPAVAAELSILAGLAVAGVVLNRRYATKAAALQAATTHYQRFLRQVIDTNPHAIFVKDWEGRYVLANAATAEL